MKYITVADAAEKWGISERRVYILLTEGRIPGAGKQGRAWRIPANAPKPEVSRRGKSGANSANSANSENGLAADIARALEFYDMAFPVDNPDSVISAVPEHFRVLPEISLAYMRGDFKLIKRRFPAIGDTAVKLIAAEDAVLSAVHMGDYPFFLETEKWLKALIAGNISDTVTALAECALADVYLATRAPDMVAEWLKDGDFPAARYPFMGKIVSLRVKYCHLTGQFGKMFDMANTALAFCDSDRRISGSSFYLNISKVHGYCVMKRLDEAERCLLALIRRCLPNGFVSPFLETAPYLGGLFERCLEQEFGPEYCGAFSQRYKLCAENWMTFHNLFTKSNIRQFISLREMEIALLLIEHEPRSKIAGQFNLSLSRLNHIIEGLYEKLCVNSRDQLAQFIYY